MTQKKKTGPKGPSKWTKPKIDKLADKMEDYYSKNDGSFQLLDFLNQEGILRQRLPEFCERSEKFTDSLKKVKQLLEARVVNMAHDSRNPTFGIFNLKANYQWQTKEVIEQKSEITVNGSLAQMFNEMDE